MEPNETPLKPDERLVVYANVYDVDKHSFTLISNRFVIEDHGLQNNDTVRITITKEPKPDAQPQGPSL
jgi:hypothetical protein